jgi:hypothetical protein
VITLLLNVLRLLLFLVAGHRQLALENLALRQQFAVYKRTMPRPKLRTTDRLSTLGRPCQVVDRLAAGAGYCDARHCLALAAFALGSSSSALILVLSPARVDRPSMTLPGIFVAVDTR